jgi:very-short-patch-repair endonuclease
LAVLSPFWLVASVWIVILLGVICHGISPSKKQPTTKQKITPLLENITLNERQIEMPIQSTKLSKMLDGIVMPSVGMSSAKTGVSEKAFRQVLQQIFPNIVQGLEFHNPDLSTPYSADFALIHPSGLSIDIEIDEPYVGNTKEPHHCTDNGKDNIRNQFFLKGNWTVIRFSEKQVVLYPKSCCKVIASVIARVTGDRTYLAQLLSIPDLPPDPMWTTRRAKTLAKENYRQTYLPIGRKK